MSTNRSWTFAPAGTPKAIVQKLNAELGKAVADRTVAANLSSQSLDPMHMMVAEFARQIRVEYERYEHIVRISGARID